MLVVWWKWMSKFTTNITISGSETDVEEVAYDSENSEELQDVVSIEKRQKKKRPNYNPKDYRRWE